MKYSELKKKIKNDLNKSIKVKKLKKIVNKISPDSLKKEIKKEKNKNAIYSLVLKKIKSS